MKYRCFKLNTDEILFDLPSDSFQKLYEKEGNFDKCKIPEKFINAKMIIIDKYYVDVNFSCEHTTQRKCNGEFHQDNLRIDNFWFETLMPSQSIKNRYIDKLNKKIKIELENPSPNLTKFSILQFEKEKNLSIKCNCEKKSYLGSCKCGHDNYWYQQALKNLDERVQNGESDKPLIRQKLLEKIQEFKNDKT